MNRKDTEAGRLTRALRALMTGPEKPEREFLLGGATYGEVYAMAAHLKTAMAGHGGPAALCTENRAIITAALIAGLYSKKPLLVPHAVSAPVLAEAHQQTGFSLAVVDGDPPLPAGVRALRPDPVEGAGAAGAAAAETAAPPAPDATWVYLFTGGSTGRPRIWSKTVENLLGEAYYLAETFGFGADDRVVATVTPLHIYGILYSVLAPVVGGAAVSARRPSFPREIAAAVEESRATILISVPVHYRAMRETEVYGRKSRLAFSSAGPLDAADAEAFFSHTGTGVTEIYGSTETGGIASRCRAEGQQALHPFEPVDVRVDAGLLSVKSAFLSPELARDASGYFKTTDRAAKAPEGGFFVLGRVDGVVKVGGKRVDTEELRDRIRSCPGIREAVVAALPTESGRQSLLGALVEGDVALEELRAHLAERLEPCAMPRRIRVVDKIPTTPAGKFDRERVVDLLNG